MYINYNFYKNKNEEEMKNPGFFKKFLDKLNNSKSIFLDQKKGETDENNYPI